MIDLNRLKELEERIYQIARDDFGLNFCDIEFDIVPKEKMFEIMAYRLPGQVSNWKYGRDFERTRTIYERRGGGLPYETVINTNPSRAYLMKDNSFAVQALIIAHVVGHVAFFTMNKYFQESDKDIVGKLTAAHKRINDYERKYGIDLIEKTVDAGHAIQLHSSPFESNLTEEEKRQRIFEQEKKVRFDRKETEFSSFFPTDTEPMDRDKFNNALWMQLKNRTPVEPTEDLLRYIIDNSRNLSDWQKDILEVLRFEGRYYYPQMKTKYMNEGFATWLHEAICRKLFRDGTLTAEEHSEFNYINAGVKAMNPFSMNPYLIGCSIFEDIEDRWNKGKHGEEWDNCISAEQRKNWDTGAMQGIEKIREVVRTLTDWIFMSNYLTTDLVRDLKMYVHVRQKNEYRDRVVITDKKADEIRQMVIKSFSHSGIPKIRITNGNYNDMGILYLEHEHVGIDLDDEYTKRTLAHIAYIWGTDVHLKTKTKGGILKEYKATVTKRFTGEKQAQSH